MTKITYRIFDVINYSTVDISTLLKKQSKFLRYSIKCRGKRDTT